MAPGQYSTDPKQHTPQTQHFSTAPTCVPSMLGLPLIKYVREDLSTTNSLETIAIRLEAIATSKKGHVWCIDVGFHGPVWRLSPIVTGATVIGMKYKDGVILAADTLASEHPENRNKDKGKVRPPISPPLLRLVRP